MVITGLAVNTPLADEPAAFLEALLAGRSAISRWRGLDTENIEVKIGGDLSAYDIAKKVEALRTLLPPGIFRRMRKLIARVPWSNRLSLLLGAASFLDAGAFDRATRPDRTGVIVAGHNLNSHYDHQIRATFARDPNFIEPLAALHTLDTTHGSAVSEMLGLHGPLLSAGGACASGNLALRIAVDEIRHHGAEAMLVLGPVLDFSPVELQSLAMMGALSCASFNDEPERASRPFDLRREGFVAAHGGGALFVESLESALRRGARIYAEVLGAEASSDANYRTNASEDGQVLLIARLLEVCGIAPEQVDYVNAHATSTPSGDLSEVRALKRVFGDHAKHLRVNATKSMLGHTCWSAAVVELVAVLLQMRAGRLHPTINLEQPDADADLDFCVHGAVNHAPRVALKNAFGFGGINCVSLLQSPAAAGIPTA